MKIEEMQVTLRKLTASEGMMLTDKETQTIRSTEIYIGKDEDKNNFIEIDKNTPFTEPEATTE